MVSKGILGAGDGDPFADVTEGENGKLVIGSTRDRDAVVDQCHDNVSPVDHDDGKSVGGVGKDVLDVGDGVVESSAHAADNENLTIPFLCRMVYAKGGVGFVFLCRNADCFDMFGNPCFD